MPLDILESMNLKKRILDSSGGPIQRFIVSPFLKNRDSRALARLVRSQLPKDVVKQQEMVAQAEALVFIALIFWLEFPAILKGWFERVFNYGFAFELTREGWEGNFQGRVPLLHHEKALIITPTLLKEEDYKGALGEAITTIVDSWGLRYPGVKNVEHVYFYGTPVADAATRQTYLERAYLLGGVGTSGAGPGLCGRAGKRYAANHHRRPFFPRFGFKKISREEVPGPVQASEEFKGACPASAIVMQLDLARPPLLVRLATEADLPAITLIYNQGIEDKATLENEPRTVEERRNWFITRDERHPVVVVIRKELIPAYLLGRVLSFSLILSTAAMPLAAITASLLTQIFDPALVFVAAALTKLGEFLIASHSAMRRL